MGRGNYLQLMTYTLPIAFTYTPIVFVPFANIDVAQFQNEIEKLNFCVITWSFGFAFQIFFDKFKIKEKCKNLSLNVRVIKKEVKPSVIIPIIAICLSFNVIANNIYNAGFILQDGYHSVYTKDADLLLKTTTIFPLYIWFNSLLLACKINKPKDDEVVHGDFKYAILIYWLSLVTFMAVGSRSTVVYILLTLICIKYSGRALHILNIIFLAIPIISILSIVGVVREGGDITENLNLLNRTIAELSQTTLVFMNSIEIMSFDLSRYINLMTTVFPQTIMNWIGVTPPISLAQEYAEMIDPGWAKAGGGFGFSIFAEMYIAGGLAFLLLIAIFIASMSAYINRVYTNKNDGIAIASCSVISFYLFALARGDSYDLYRPIFFAITIYYMSKIRMPRRIVNKTI